MYAVIQNVNGNFSIVSEHGENLQAARVAFHNTCSALWNAEDVVDGFVAIVDDNLNFVDGRIEHITHHTEEENDEES